MPLSQDEARCVELTCLFLDMSRGPRWEVVQGPTLDDRNPSARSPEVLITNQRMTAAVEVKGLSGPSLREYEAAQSDLHEFLAPSNGGHYRLTPAVQFRLPARRRLKLWLKDEIERVAARMVSGDTAAVCIPRRGNITARSIDGAGYVYCARHGQFGALVEASERLSGTYELTDTEYFMHRFMTGPARAEFVDQLVAACLASQGGAPASITWHEEWELTRDDDAGNAGVLIVAATVWDAVEAVNKVVRGALRKFDHRWADLHILTLHDSPLDDRVVENTVPGLMELGQSALDLVLLIEGGTAHQVWPSDRNGLTVPTQH